MATPFAKSEKNPANNLSCSFVSKIFFDLCLATQFYFDKLYAKMQAVNTESGAIGSAPGWGSGGSGFKPRLSD